jgi:hypothetical protein
MERVNKRPSLAATLLILAASLLGMLLVLYATSGGPGVGSDATIYITSAQNLLAGNGLGWLEPDGSFHRLDYYPPFYPLALTLSGLIFNDVVAGARWLNVLLFGGLIGVIGAWYYSATHRPILAGILSGVLAVSPVLLGVVVWAMSEPVFLLTGFTGLALLTFYLARPRSLVLVLAALLTGLAFLSRYLGVAFVITGALALLWDPVGYQSIRDRLRRAFFFGILAVLPMIIWLALDFAISGTIGGRSGFPAGSFLTRFFATFPALEPIVLFWLLPESVAGRLPGVVRTMAWLAPVAVMIAFAVWTWGRYISASASTQMGISNTVRLALMMGLFVIVYIPVLATLQAVVYPPVAVDLRMLSPVHLALVVLLFALIYIALRLLGPVKVWTSRLVLLAALALFGMYALRGGMVVREYHRTGIGYSTAAWRQSPMVRAVNDLPASTALITNDKAAVMFLSGRPAYEVIEIYQDQPDLTFPVYGSGTDPSQRIFREQGGALVLFRASLDDDFGNYGDRMGERLAALTDGLFPYFEGEDGAIYFYQQPALQGNQ